MKIIQTNIFILPSIIILLSACTSIQTKETSTNKEGQAVVKEISELSIDSSPVSRIISLIFGKPVSTIEAEPAASTAPAPKLEKAPVENKPEPVVQQDTINKTPTKDPKCPFKITVKTADSSISVDC